jgi:hypothetical protein
MKRMILRQRFGEFNRPKIADVIRIDTENKKSQNTYKFTENVRRNKTKHCLKAKIRKN